MEDLMEINGTELDFMQQFVCLLSCFYLRC